jgi:acyl transferase domain-containing protein
MRPAATELRHQLRGLAWQALRVPVFSPILGRYYTSSDDLTECLAHHLVGCVEFAAAIRSLASLGVAHFVECGPLRGLARSIHQITASTWKQRRVTSSAPHACSDELTGARTDGSNHMPAAALVSGDFAASLGREMAGQCSTRF